MAMPHNENGDGQEWYNKSTPYHMNAENGTATSAAFVDLVVGENNTASTAIGGTDTAITQHDEGRPPSFFGHVMSYVRDTYSHNIPTIFSDPPSSWNWYQWIMVIIPTLWVTAVVIVALFVARDYYWYRVRRLPPPTLRVVRRYRSTGDSFTEGESSCRSSFDDEEKDGGNFVGEDASSLPSVDVIDEDDVTRDEEGRATRRDEDGEAVCNNVVVVSSQELPG